MKQNMQPDSLVDLKFIMADTGFGKTYIYDRIKRGELEPPVIIDRRAKWELRAVTAFKNKLRSKAKPSNNIRMKEIAKLSAEKRKKNPAQSA